MNNFGLVHSKGEGAPAHPDDILIHCGCKTCELRFKKQAKAYFDHLRLLGFSEERLALESYYEKP